jgi:hypothetical protein
MRIAWIILKLLPIIMVWCFVSYYGFALENYFAPIYDLGNDYEMWGGPKAICHWQSREEAEHELIIPISIEALNVNDDWIVGKTRKGFFAISKKSHEVFYPYNTYDQLQSACDVNISINEAIPLDISQYLVVDYTCLRPILLTTTPPALVLMVVAIIGFRRSGRFLLSPFVRLKKRSE